MTLRSTIIRALADGRFHSGEDLAHALGVSRSAVWKHVRSLAAVGLPVDAVRGKGYRLGHELELLEPTAIEDALSPGIRARVYRLQVFAELDSTNTYLVRQAPPPAGTADLCLAEYQSRGRGRHGRIWSAPFGAGISLSLGWSFSEPPPQLGSLSLVLGVAVTRALDTVDGLDVKLKWPNDILWHGRKLGGILVELRAEMGGPAHIVAGIGLNVRLPEATRLEIGSPWGVQVVDLAEVTGGRPPSRNRLAAALVASAIEALEEFQLSGFAPFRSEWEAHDALAAQPVRIELAGGNLQGQALGVDAEGAILVDVAGQLRRFVCGEVSVRQ